jgi:hypothetical protein
MNLLAETLEALRKNGKSPADVCFVQTGRADSAEPRRQLGGWADFERVANIEYDDGLGVNYIDSTLVIVGDDWWLERDEYDGSEWWEYKTHPKAFDLAAPLTVVLERA